MAKITFSVPGESTEHVLEVSPGESILEAAQRAKVYIESVCRGCCSCGACHVVVKAGAVQLSPSALDEKMLLRSIPESIAGSRLACQAKALN